MKEANDACDGYQFVVAKEEVVEFFGGDPEFLVHSVEGVGAEGVGSPPQQQEHDQWVDKHSDKEDDRED